VYETYFPGSTFKPFSALAALEDGSMDRSVRVDCPGYYELGNRKFRCTHAHGEVGIHGALVQSCNVYFYRLAEQVGLDRLAHYAREFGFGQPTGLGINTENGGFVASRQWYIDRYGKPYRLGFTLNTAIGQGNTRTTLLQMGMAYAALANGGKLYAPQLVKRLEAPDGEVIEEFTPRLRREVEVEAEHMQLVLDGLYGVVHNRDGTAHAALIKGGVPVAGKTGTAEVAKRLRKGQDPKRAWYYRRDHAWFVGLAPRTDPEIVVVVLVEHGGAGGKTAAPIAMEIVQEYLGGEEEAQAKRRRSGDATYAARGER
jgi:penicillin-binding protein 2